MLPILPFCYINDQHNVSKEEASSIFNFIAPGGDSRVKKTGANGIFIYLQWFLAVTLWLAGVATFQPACLRECSAGSGHTTDSDAYSHADTVSHSHSVAHSYSHSVAYSHPHSVPISITIAIAFSQSIPVSISITYPWSISHPLTLVNDANAAK